MMQTARPISRLSFGSGALAVEGSRTLPEETAIAISYNGTTQAIMMATPADLIDFAYGFSLTEGIARPEDIDTITPVETPKGIDLQIWLHPQAEARLTTRRRAMTGPVGCGLCGIDSLDEALRTPTPIPEQAFIMSPNEVRAAIATLPGGQPLHDTTHAAHAAGFWSGKLLATREDVGRHNALDKLGGHLARTPHPTGAILLTSRVSIDMVQKVAALGQPILIAVSAPTAHAVDLAQAAGMTLIALARPDRFEVFTHPDRIAAPKTGASHVA
jgi:FdhD protein